MDALFFARLRRIKRRIGALRIVGYAAFVRQRLVVVRAIPIAAPFPDIARHVVETVTIGRETFHWREPCVSVLACIFLRKFPLPRIGHPFVAGPKFITPNVCFSRQPAARRKFKFGFSRQTFSRPFGVSFCVRISDLDYRIILLAFDIALRPERMPPVGAFSVAPPLIMIGESNIVIGGREHHRACYKIFSRRSWKFFLGWRPFRYRDVTGSLNKFLELPVRHWSRLHPEAIYANAMNRTGVVRRHWHFMAAFAIYDGARREFASRNPDHSFWRFARGSRFVRERRRECGTSLLRVKRLCRSGAETDNRNKAKNDWPHFSLRSLLRYFLRFPQFSCQPRLDSKASYLLSPSRSCR